MVHHKRRGERRNEQKEADCIPRHYADKIGSVVMEMYMGLQHERMVSASLLDAAMAVKLRLRWTEMRTMDVTAHIRHLPHEKCTPTSNALREEVRNMEVIFIHPTTMHSGDEISQTLSGTTACSLMVSKR